MTQRNSNTTLREILGYETGLNEEMMLEGMLSRSMPACIVCGEVPCVSCKEFVHAAEIN